MANSKGPRICEQIKSDGIRCEACAIEDSTFCFFHDGSKANARRSAQRAGGIARARGNAAISDSTAAYPLETAADGLAMLGEVTKLVLRGKLDARRATAIGYLVSIFFRGFSLHNIESRLGALEEVMKKRKFDPEIPVADDDTDQFDFQSVSKEAESDGGSRQQG